MATSKLFKKVPTTVPNRSGFNMSHNNFFSAPVGTLVPSFIDFLIPGDEIDLSSKLHIQLPPMATDFYGRIEAKEEAFFVPARILFGGWKDFYVNPVDGTTNPSNIEGQLAKYLIGASLGSSFVSKAIRLPKPTVFGGSLSSAAVEALNGYASTIGFDFNFDEYEGVSYATSWNGQIFFNQDLVTKILLVFDRSPNSASDNALSTITPTFSNTMQFLINYLKNIIDSDDYSPIIDSSEPTSAVANLGAGSLSDYLGFKVKNPDFSDFKDIVQSAYDFLSAVKSRGFVETSAGPSMTQVFLRLFEFGNYTTDSFILYRFNSDPEDSDYERGFNPGFLINSYNPANEVLIPNILPYMCYHKVFDDWYRAPMIQQSLFKRNVANSSTATSVANMPWITSGAEDKVYFTGQQLYFANGHSLFDLHQRNWQKDYFTSATPEPQAGEASSVKFDVTDNTGEFTIASLRAANALQQWLDKNNIGGFRYGDMIYAQYGVYPSDAITDRAIYLGSTSVDVYNKSIYQQSGDGGTDTNNPFNAIGSKYSNPTGVGNGTFCNNYHVTEAGFVIKIFSLVPQAYYSTGVRRFFMHNDISDIAFPVLAGVGDQPIYGYELTDTFEGSGDKSVFGYVQRYADYKFIDDQVHGLLRDGYSLDSFALQRSFDSVPQLGSDFLQIPREYLDQVSATSYKLSEYGCWVNCYNDYRKSSTLPAYSIPTLEDMKGHTVLVDKGGKYLD